jgi:c-di-GMP-binding flagellar brake protein YcgR
MALLARACEESVHAHLSLRRKATGAGEARFVALERDGLLLRWTGSPVAEADLDGQPIEVRFDVEGEQFVFFAVSRGRVEHALDDLGARSVLKLSVPLRLERARRNRLTRINMEGLPPIIGVFTHVVDDRRQFRARLTDVADGGLGVAARTADVPDLHTGDLFWVDFELPGEGARSEFVLRLVHLRPIKNTDELALGWAFQPTDDVADHERFLQRLESGIARQQRHGGDREKD